MDNESLLAKVRDMEHEFITHWLNAVSSQFADADKDHLYQIGRAYFQYMTELAISAENHPAISHAAQWFMRSDNDMMTVQRIHYNSRSWRQALHAIGGKLLTMELFKRFCDRIDHFESEMCRIYWEQAAERTKEKELVLDQLHDDRMNLIGKMASSMAHEIRNPLTSIKGFLKLLRTGIHQQPFHKADSYLDYIEHECDNILMQVTGFLSFSKRPIMEEEPVYISAKQVLDHNISLLNPRLIDENVDLTLAVPEHIKIRVQKLAIQQVLSNLLNNGVDALSSVKTNKRITIICYEDHANAYIRVSNNGPKIPPELGQTIFTPFVTNKENGTGLGLAICKQIMLQNNGDISYTSNDQETAFLLTFRRS
ncbi:sensor histidine kinase [Paenibacillus piri]|uniref:histidine kinase n=1 Tax=Paenibacillus piri TaxID=2547395 RepID=A0A4R5KR80_9BACL|nr:HAMP domain-containing sensor histidine kinase [Paenibacillus piri]TDF97508.1 HAMP domain-containing histidine kinase [Paenibacillus piri]